MNWTKVWHVHLQLHAHLFRLDSLFVVTSCRCVCGPHITSSNFNSVHVEPFPLQLQPSCVLWLCDQSFQFETCRSEVSGLRLTRIHFTWTRPTFLQRYLSRPLIHVDLGWQRFPFCFLKYDALLDIKGATLNNKIMRADMTVNGELRPAAHFFCLLHPRVPEQP